MSIDLSEIKRDDLAGLSDDDLKAALGEYLDFLSEDRRENQLLYYRPVSGIAQKIHESDARVLGVGGGNGSSKTESCLVDIVALATGVFPDSIREFLKPRFKGPIKCRVVVESLTTVLHPIILPKLQWWRWTGISEPGGDKGHWGWVPKNCLKEENWDKAWTEKLRMLTVLCRNPDNPDEVLGESSIQFMSHDQDPSDFASGDFDIILHDEPPSHAIWTENEARTMRAAGRLMLAMTWPDDPAIPVDWIFDDIYDPGVRGDPGYCWIDLYTTDNPHLNQESVAKQAQSWSDEIRRVRIYGQPIRFSNRIHPLFTSVSHWWCFECGGQTFADILPGGEHGGCSKCGSRDIVSYCHVAEVHPSTRWPTIFVLDPHPRKPHMWCWVQVDGNDDLAVIAEGEIEGDPSQVRDAVFRTEEALGLHVVSRIVDPNMARSPASYQRNYTWRDAFEEAGLILELADTSDVGRARINEYLRPDHRTLRPRLVFSHECPVAVQQMQRYVWDDYRRKMEKDQKQRPRNRYDDYPSMLKYVLNTNPVFAHLNTGAPVIRRYGGLR